MDYLYLSSFGTLLGTLIVTLTYVYFYFVYRERYMGLWVTSWLIFVGKLVLFDYGIFDWKHSVAGFIVYQLLFLSCALIFLWGIHLFAGKPLHPWWLYSTGAAITLGFLFAIFDLPFYYRLLPAAWLGGIILIAIGKIFMRDLRIKGAGNLITGYAFLFWGLLTIYMPYSINIPWLSPWCYLSGGILRLVIACGILLVYFEKTRTDLVNKETQYRLLAENALDVIYHYKILPEAKFEYISPAALTVTGYAPEEFYANPALMNSLIHPNDIPLFNTFHVDPSSPGASPLTFRLIRKDQSVIWVERTCVSIYDKEGKILASEGILRDVTARKNMEQIVSRIDKLNMVGQMAASVAHEIRNPLTSVRGYLQFMQKQQASGINKDRYDLMIAELDRTNTIISEYLLLAKDKVPNLKNCCLNQLIHTLLPLMEATAVSSNICIRPCLDTIPKLYLDENEIRQLLLNLVTNALEAMPKGGELVIRTYRENDKVMLSISDQGSGIPLAVLEHIGTPFLTTKDTGTGLGLPICYRIAHRHNAVIQVKTSDQGTTFFIQFGLSRIAA
jgi:PAS domain S-box-containing protein